MSPESFEGAFLKRMDLLIEDARSVLVRGSVPDYDAYRELRGKILALEATKFEFQDLVKHYRERNDL